MCRCLMAIDVVSQHGPNPQSRTADRSVSLPDARETAAEMMGSVTSIRLQRLRARHADLQKRHGDRLRDTSAPYDQALEQVVEELAEIEAEIRELDPPDDPPPPPLVQTWDLDDPAQRKAAIEKWGGRHLDPVPDLPPGTSAMAGEPPRTGRAHPERPPAPYEPGPEISEEDRKRGKEEIEKIRKEYDFLNPESRMDASILPEMLAQGTAQESEGYFGGLGNLVESVVEAVPGIDTKTAIMIATAIAAATAAGTGFGGPLVPPILAGGALLSSQ